MPVTLSKGYKLPQNGERGWWQTLIDNWTRLNSHDHDGTDSEKISSANLSFTTQDLSASNWSSVGGGTYRQTVSLPAGMSFPAAVVNFYTDSGTGHQVFPKVVKIDSSSYYVYVNDNTVDLKAVYG